MIHVSYDILRFVWYSVHRYAVDTIFVKCYFLFNYSYLYSICSVYI